MIADVVGFFSTNWRFPATLLQSSLSAPFFPMPFSYFMSLSYFSRSHNILSFLIYYYICYDLWSSISDVTIVIIWGMHKRHPYTTVNLTNIVSVLTDCFTNEWSPLPTLSWSLPSLWDTKTLKFGQLITLNGFQAFKWREELNISHFKSKIRNDYFSQWKHVKNQCMPKAKHLAPVSQPVTTKEKFLKEIKSCTPVKAKLIRKWNSFPADTEKVLAG